MCGEMKPIRKLNFNAPLLSVRRPCGGGTAAELLPRTEPPEDDASDRVPFSWEQAAGRPKDDIDIIVSSTRFLKSEDEDFDDDDDKPLPPVPPRRQWHRRVQAFDHLELSHLELADNGSDSNSNDDDDDDDDDDDFSDAMDMFSLSEMSIDIVESGEYLAQCSPNFIIRRFLPAANALAVAAAASSSSIVPTTTRQLHTTERARASSSSASASASASAKYNKNCGVQGFFGWGMMKQHRLCGVKSPVKHRLCAVKPSPTQTK